jgi:cell division inhibitor SepF
MSNGFINKVMDIFGMGDEDEDIDDAAEEVYDEDDDEQLEVFPKGRKNKVVSIHSGINAKIVVMEPSEFDEITTICDCLKNKKIVIVNLNNVDTKLAQRFVDFTGGAAYALDGEIQEVSSGILLITPCNVDVSSDVKDELSGKGLFSWTASR